MKKKILMLLAACAVLALFLSAVFLYNRLFDRDLQELQKQQDQQAATQTFVPPTTTRPAPTEPTGHKMQNFTLTDSEGNTIKLSELKGKPVVIHFWASWSADSTAGFSHMETLKQTYGDNIHILLVNLADGTKETRETATAWLASKTISCPVYFDDGTVAAEFSTEEVPMTFFLNAEGVAKAYIDTVIMQADLDKAMNTILPSENHP